MTPEQIEATIAKAKRWAEEAYERGGFCAGWVEVLADDVEALATEMYRLRQANSALVDEYHDEKHRHGRLLDKLNAERAQLRAAYAEGARVANEERENEIQRMTAECVDTEREACAIIADDQTDDRAADKSWKRSAANIATRIRARKEPRR